MIIKGKNFPNIGHIRCKALPNSEWLLEIYAPEGGPIDGHGGATQVDVVVSADELDRIERAAPHLVPGKLERDRRRMREKARPAPPPQADLSDPIYDSPPRQLRRAIGADGWPLSD
jgi:hypothetical protein